MKAIFLHRVIIASLILGGVVLFMLLSFFSPESVPQVAVSEASPEPPVGSSTTPVITPETSEEPAHPVMPLPILPTPTSPTTPPPATPPPGIPPSIPPPTSTPLSPSSPPPTQTFKELFYSFSSPGILQAAGSMAQSSSPYFWISSGGRLEIKEGMGQTIQGELPLTDGARIVYAKVNPLDTDQGKLPQNTFRLVSKSIWQNAEERILFRVTKHNLTDTPNRDGYSGIFLMTRYRDKDNLYYAGLRNDGFAVIKKKIKGTYYTLSDVQYFTGVPYDKLRNPSLIPTNIWMGIKVETVTEVDGSVRITLFVDQNNTGTWQKVLSATDRGVGGKPFGEAGYGGIRTDYMDVEFDYMSFKNI